MPELYQKVLDDLVAASVIGVCVEPVKGRHAEGAWVISDDGGLILTRFIVRDENWERFTRGLLERVENVCVWDLRRIIDWPLGDRPVWDVRSIYGGDQSLLSLSQKMDSLWSDYTKVYENFLRLDRRVDAHARALRTAKITVPLPQALPEELFLDWTSTRAQVTWDLYKRSVFSSGPEGYLSGDYEARWPFILALRQMELNGIKIDPLYVQTRLEAGDDPANMAALRSLHGLCRDGYVTALYNPMGGKTGRLRHEGGFNALAIPHGSSRDAIVSRFEGGAIFGFDFNAIDYRCIVNSVGGDLAALYAGASDFHERTASFIFKTVTPTNRNAIKYVSYIYIYGGSSETLAEKTGWTPEQVQQVLSLLDQRIAPIKEFRERLWMRAQETGTVETPGGRRVYTKPDDSPGKIIGLYAQTFSSWVFEQAVVRAQALLRQMKSKLIFTVHDELVIDAHPDDFDRMDEIRRAMQLDGHVVKVKKGKSYGQIE